MLISDTHNINDRNVKVKETILQETSHRNFIRMKVPGKINLEFLRTIRSVIDENGIKMCHKYLHLFKIDRFCSLQ